MKGDKMRAKVWTILTLFFAAILFTSCGGGDSETQQAEQQKASQPMPWERKLAIIDGHVSRDDIAVIRFKTLLDQLSSKYNGTRQQISDVTVKGQSLLRDKYGIEESLLNIMEDMNQVLITKVNPSYPVYATAYVHLRKTGISRQQTINGIESFVKSIERF